MAISFNQQKGSAQKSSISTYQYTDGDNKMRIYATQCIDNGEVKVVNLKKKLWEQIITAAEDLGDPTDCHSGWDIIFKRVKTGPLPYNVEYQLQALKCKTRALTDSELELFQGIKSMDDVMPRPTADAQKELLDRIRQATTSEVDDTLEDEFKVG